jgi:hypothetical protein
MGRLGVAAAVMCAIGCATWLPMASGSLMCPEDKIEYDRTDEGLIVMGCDRVDVLTAEKGNQWSSLRARASFEMSCNTSAIDITVLSPSVYGVTGCNKKLVYKNVPLVGIVVDSIDSSHTAPAAP